MSTYHSTFTRDSGLTVWASCCVLSGLLAFLMLQSTLVPTVSAARKDVVKPPEYLARAGVSVVRIVATYSPQTLAPAIASSKTKSTATTVPTSASIACTGLGVIVANWTDAAGGVNEQNAYILTDSSLVNTKEFACATSSISGTPLSGTQVTKLLSLSSVKVYFSTAYSNAQPTGITINTNTVRCGIEDKCSDGISLFSFHSTTLLPLVKLPDVVSPVQSTAEAIQLNLSSSTIATPSRTSVPQQYLTPTATPAQVPTGSNSSIVEALEAGTPIVDQHGLINGLYTKNGSKTKLFPAENIRTLLNSQKLMTDQQHPNAVNDAWQSGMTAYAQGTSQYVQANTDFKHAYTASNATFQGAQTFVDLTNPAIQGSNGTTSNGTSSGANKTSNNGLNLSLFLAIGAVGIVVILLLLFLLNLLFRRAQRHRDFVEADKQATIQAQKIQQREAQIRAMSPRTHQPMQQVAPYPMQQVTNGTLNAPLVASLSPAPIVPVQSSALADYPTIDMGEVQRKGTLDMDKTQPFSPIMQHPTRADAEHIGFEVITSTNPGIKRKYKPNEDSLFAIKGMRNENGQLQQIGLFVVADGMGGHANGQDASRLAIQTIIDFLLPRLIQGEDTRETAEKLLVDSVQLANQAVHQHNIEHNADMGTTVTATLIVGATAHVANVGDSRTYLYRASDGLTKVTRDHSVVASLVDAGIIKPDDIYTHPKRNQIYRSLGEKPFVEVDPFIIKLQPGDKLLLCSDGLWDMVRDPEIKHVLETQTSDPQQLGNNLIAAALNGGGEDNVSVIVVNVVDQVSEQPTPGLETIYVQDNIKLPPLG
ncbi:MAG: hypothetical protein NVS2B2_36280 [Ktedonobacteraceae bacterium]